jgi:hypothetical protein
MFNQDTELLFPHVDPGITRSSYRGPCVSWFSGDGYGRKHSSSFGVRSDDGRMGDAFRVTPILFGLSRMHPVRPANYRDFGTGS